MGEKSFFCFQLFVIELHVSAKPKRGQRKKTSKKERHVSLAEVIQEPLPLKSKIPLDATRRFTKTHRMDKKTWK